MIKKLALIFILFLTTIALGKSSSSSSHSSSSRSSYSSGSSRSYSSGSVSKPSSSPSSSKSSYSSGSSRSYSSGSVSKPSSSTSGSSSGSKASSWFGRSKADTAQAKSESKTNFNTYKASQIQTKYKANPESYNYLKSQPKEVYTSRPARQQTVFHNYRNQQPTVIYQDRGWNPFFWMWLMDRPNQQAEWVYHHRSELSDERYKDLLTKNKDLEGQLKAIEEKKIPKDANFAPKEIDKDLMYSDEMAKESQEEEKTDYSWLWWFIGTPIILGTVGYGVYAIFFKERYYT